MTADLEKLKRHTPHRVKSKIKFLRNFFWMLIQIGKPKVFCISMQRNGTTSVGQFLKDHNYRVASYGQHSKDWSSLWVKGDYDSIFKSVTFKSYQAYEDNPWWFPDFYRVLHNKFSRAKFILLYRDGDKWFESMKNHKTIQSLKNTYRHNKVYNKLDLFYEKLDTDDSFKPNEINGVNDIPFDEEKERYLRAYQIYNRDAIEYFKKYAPDKLFYTRLDDPEKWQKIGSFLGIKVAKDYNIHSNKTI